MPVPILMWNMTVRVRGICLILHFSAHEMMTCGATARVFEKQWRLGFSCENGAKIAQTLRILKDHFKISLFFFQKHFSRTCCRIFYRRNRECHHNNQSQYAWKDWATVISVTAYNSLTVAKPSHSLTSSAPISSTCVMLQSAAFSTRHKDTLAQMSYISEMLNKYKLSNEVRQWQWGLFSLGISPGVLLFTISALTPRAPRVYACWSNALFPARRYLGLFVVRRRRSSLWGYPVWRGCVCLRRSRCLCGGEGYPWPFVDCNSRLNRWASWIRAPVAHPILWVFFWGSGSPSLCLSRETDNNTHTQTYRHTHTHTLHIWTTSLNNRP